jgi:hypothetical protein
VFPLRPAIGVLGGVAVRLAAVWEEFDSGEQQESPFVLLVVHAHQQLDAEGGNAADHAAHDGADVGGGLGGGRGGGGSPSSCIAR